jgi:hypothetical protein
MIDTPSELSLIRKAVGWARIFPTLGLRNSDGKKKKKEID